jgi:hypothetical protein
VRCVNIEDQLVEKGDHMIFVEGQSSPDLSCLLVQVDAKLLEVPQLQYMKVGPRGNKVVTNLAKEPTWNIKDDVQFYKPGKMESYGVAAFLGKEAPFSLEVRMEQQSPALSCHVFEQF